VAACNSRKKERKEKEKKIELTMTKKIAPLKEVGTTMTNLKTSRRAIFCHHKSLHKPLKDGEATYTLTHVLRSHATFIYILKFQIALKPT
jgi:hypothetical protein